MVINMVPVKLSCESNLIWLMNIHGSKKYMRFRIWQTIRQEVRDFIVREMFACGSTHERLCFLLWYQTPLSSMGQTRILSVVNSLSAVLSENSSIFSHLERIYYHRKCIRRCLLPKKLGSKCWGVCVQHTAYRWLSTVISWDICRGIDNQVRTPLYIRNRHFMFWMTTSLMCWLKSCKWVYNVFVSNRSASPSAHYPHKIPHPDNAHPRTLNLGIVSRYSLPYKLIF